jgi:hypothetical protein
MNDELRDALGQWISNRIQHNLAENEDLTNVLNVFGKPILEAKPNEKPTEQQFNGLDWVTKEGTRGAYTQTENNNSEAFKLLAEYVKAHKGFCNLYGWKVWIHNQNENLIDRKR